MTSIKQYVLDADCVLAFLEDKPGAVTVEGLLWMATQAQQFLHMSVISWSFLLCGIWQSKGEQAARDAARQLEQLPIDLIEVDAIAADSAASICATHDVPFPECFALALAQQRRATLVTTNKALSKLHGQLKILIAT